MKMICLSSKTVILALLAAVCVSADSTLRSRLKFNRAEIEAFQHQ